MEESLANKTKKGVIWQTLSLLCNSGFTFIVSIILARKLIPSDYGIIAMITVFTSVLQIFTDGGLSTALLRKENRTAKDISTVFFCNFTACYVIYAIIFICAPFIADFYNNQDICKITRIFTLSLLISPFYSIPLILLKSKIDFKTKCRVEIISNVFYAIIAITMVYNGWGIWSLIVPSLIAQLITGIQYNIIIKWSPKGGFSKRSFKELFGYSSKLLVARVFNKIYANLAPMFIGKYFSPSILGLYERAKSWPALPSQTLAISFQSVTFPVLCKLQNDRERLTYSYVRLIKMTAFIIFPLMIGLASVAKPLTLVVLTETWVESAGLMQLICLSYMWFPILLINANLLTVTGRSDLYLKCEILKNLIGFLVLISCLPFGVRVYCFFEIIAAYISLVISSFFATKIINYSVWRQIREVIPIFLNCCMMGLISTLALKIAHKESIQLLLGIVSGGLYYIVSSRLLFKATFFEALNLIKSRI